MSAKVMPIPLDPSQHIARQIAIVKVIERAPESAKKTLTQAFEHVASPRGAIRAQCLVCTGFDRDAIRNCSGWNCPLWQYRPFTEEVAAPTPGDNDAAVA